MPLGSELHECAVAFFRQGIETLPGVDRGDLDPNADYDEDSFSDGHFGTDEQRDLLTELAARVLPGCGIISRIEKLCEANVFASDFKAFASWGRL